MPLAARRRLACGLLSGSLSGALLTGCTGDATPAADRSGPSGPTTSAAAGRASALDSAISHPVEDRVYPRVGDPGVDALHYDLHLAWEPRTDTLTARETVVLRATADADALRLDLGHSLRVSSLRVDGEHAAYSHPGKDLVVRHPVVADQRYTLQLAYAGRPRPVPAPTTRTDLDRLGWTVTDAHEVWTMQEPYGAYSWYAVNDQPSDKAFYDVTVSAPSPMVGIANGTLESRTDRGGTTVTRWHLDEPAASYLTTVAIGRYDRTADRSAGGVPVTWWTPPDRPRLARRLAATTDALDWVEERLGAYPFSSLGVVLVDSRSGMETQTMLTLGDSAYATSEAVLVHEIVHQWYGDEVTPTDWRDVWMNEGMAMYLQGVWQAEHDGRDLDSLMGYWARFEPQMRRLAGPPADYDRTMFGSGNVYYGPALMWHELRKRLGDEEFWSLVRDWPRSHDDGNASYDDITSWWSQRTGEDLRPFFDAWLLGEDTPPRS